MSEQDRPSELELELAALGKLPEKRITELVDAGYGEHVEALRARNIEFHARHDRNMTLRAIERRHAHARREEDMQTIAPPSSLRYTQRMAIAGALVAVGALALWTFAQTPPGTSSSGTNEHTHGEDTTVGGDDATSRPPSVPCDMTREWSAAERKERTAYEADMRHCLDEALRVIESASASRELAAPPLKLLHACKQHYGYACAALTTLRMSGISPFDGTYPDPDGRHARATMDEQLRRYEATKKLFPNDIDVTTPPDMTWEEKPWTTDAELPAAECDTSRQWTQLEREAAPLGSPMLANAYWRSMYECVHDALLKLEARPSAQSPSLLVHACAQRSSTACAILGAHRYMGSWPLSDEAITDAKKKRSVDERARGARALERACALHDIPACELLGHLIESDDEVRVANGYDPERLDLYANPFADSLDEHFRGDPDATGWDDMK